MLVGPWPEITFACHQFWETRVKSAFVNSLGKGEVMTAGRGESQGCQ
jgi:hypothetical protein